MKIFVVLTAILACASTQTFDEQTEINARQERLVTNQVASAIENIRKQIREAGFDPLDVDRREIVIPPEEDFHALAAFAEDIKSTGLSNIVIITNNFSILSARLNLVLSLPRVEASVGAARVELNVFDYEGYASASGRAAINNLRVSAEVRISISVVSGISIRSLNIDLTLGGVEADLNVNLFGRDLSDTITNFLSQTVPTTIANNRVSYGVRIDNKLYKLRTIRDLGDLN
ncbi:uncharacterized protein LOC101735588 isoform X1 [Bombyx mori]|uniref:uncharacterized protein LOC101735588 isoform X1 n=1 Tax=Bombyx mori TaxID=7091 RepID=UPI002ED5560D